MERITETPNKAGDLKLHEETGEDGKTHTYLVGTLQSTQVNENKRQYPEEVWEQLHQDQHFQEQLQKGRIVGGIGHPKDGIFDPREAALKLVSQQLEGEEVKGKLEVLPTPEGNLLKTLYQAGVEMGVSSRGRGESIAESGVTKVKPGFVLEGYDAVLEPSVGKAEPELKTESVDKAIRDRMKEEDVTTKEIAGYKAFLESKENLTESVSGTIKLLESVEANLGEHSSGGSSSGSGNSDQSTAAYDESQANEAFRLSEMVAAAIHGTTNSKTEKTMPGTNNKNTGGGENLTEAIIKYRGETERANVKAQNMEQKANAAKSIISEQNETISNLKSQLSEAKKKGGSFKKKLEASKQLIQAGMDQIKEERSNTDYYKKRYEAAKQIIKQMKEESSKNNKQTLEQTKKAELEKLPENVRERAKSIFESVSDVSSLLKVSNELKEFAGTVSNSTLPFGGQGVRPSGEGKGSGSGSSSKKEEQHTKKLDPLVAAMANKQQESGKLD